MYKVELLGIGPARFAGKYFGLIERVRGSALVNVLVFSTNVMRARGRSGGTDTGVLTGLRLPPLFVRETVISVETVVPSGLVGNGGPLTTFAPGDSLRPWGRLTTWTTLPRFVRPATVVRPIRLNERHWQGIGLI